MVGVTVRFSYVVLHGSKIAFLHAVVLRFQLIGQREIGNLAKYLLMKLHSLKQRFKSRMILMDPFNRER